MKRIVIASEFNLEMINYEFVEVIISKTDLEEIKRALEGDLELYSAVTDEETAKEFSSVLGKKLEVNKEKYSLLPQDLLVVGCNGEWKVIKIM